MTKPKPITLTLKGSDLRDLFGAVLPFTETDGSPLECINIQGHGNCVTARATDRYRLGIQRHTTNAPKKLNVTLHKSAAKQILATFKPTRALDPEVTLTFERDRLNVSSNTIPLGGFGLEVGMSFALGSSKYPDLNTLLVNAESDAATGALVDPRYLASFGHVAGPLEVIVNAANKPVIIRGVNFIGALMPKRGNDVRRGLPDEWMSILGQGKVAS